MSAGTAYAKRYGGGFLDLPTKTTPVDQQFLNAVEAALLQLIGSAPTADGQVAQWDNANTRFGPALILNKNVDAAAGIVKSKLDFTGANGIVDADVSGTAAIARSKLNFGSGLVNADIAAAAAIVASKLAAYPSDATKTLRGDGTWLAQELAYAERTSNITINTIVEGSATTILTAPAVTVAAGDVLIVEFFTPAIAYGGSGVSSGVNLWLNGADIGRLYDGTIVGSLSANFPVGKLTRRVTPGAGTHTFSIRGWCGATNMVIQGGAAGAGAALPAFIRVSRAVS